MKKSSFSRASLRSHREFLLSFAATLVILIYALLAPVLAFAATEPTLPMPHDPSIPSTENAASIDSSSVDESASSTAEKKETPSETQSISFPEIYGDLSIIDSDGAAIDDLSSISETADSVPHFYTAQFEFYVSGDGLVDAAIVGRCPSTNIDNTEWRSNKRMQFGWLLRSDGSYLDNQQIREARNNYRDDDGERQNIFIRTIPNSTYLITPELPDGILLSDRDLARQEIGATIGFSSLDGKIPGGRENLCTITCRFAVSTEKESLANLTADATNTGYSSENNTENPNGAVPESNTASPTTTAASKSGATNALILHAAVDVLLIVGVSAVSLVAMNFYKREILAEILTLRDQLLRSQDPTKDANLPVADAQLGHDAPTSDDLDELGACFYAWLRAYD